MWSESYAVLSFMIFFFFVSFLLLQPVFISPLSDGIVYMCDLLVPNDWNQIKVNCDSSWLVGWYRIVISLATYGRLIPWCCQVELIIYLSYKQISLWTNAFQFVYLMKSAHCKNGFDLCTKSAKNSIRLEKKKMNYNFVWYLRNRTLLHFLFHFHSIRFIIKIVVIHRLLLHIFPNFSPLLYFYMCYLLPTHSSVYFWEKTYFDCSS